MAIRRISPAAILVVLACVVVYWPRLGSRGLSMTEGHRVLPGWSMLDSGDYLVPRLFGRAYLRKPPGMPWAVAGSSWLFGRTEFAARAVSAAGATGLALLTLWFSRRWFGPKHALGAGLGSALMPLLWAPGRSAEIEALNNLAAFGSVLCVLELLVADRGAPTRRSHDLAFGLLGAIFMIAGALVKGPANVPCLIGAVVSACVIARSARPLASRGFWVAVILSAAVVGALGYAIASAASGQAPVTQDPGEFLWGAKKLTAQGIGRVLAMPLVALASALPMSLSLVFAWGEGPSAAMDRMQPRAVALACLLSIGLYMLLGVDNPRYAMPALTLVPMLVPCAIRAASGGADGTRSRVARAMALGRTWVWPLLLIVGAIANWAWLEPRSDTSGRESGIALGAALSDGTEIRADGLIEARPEVLYYAQRAAKEAGRRVKVRWVSPAASPADMPAGVLLAVRTDLGSSEQAALAWAMGRLEPIATGHVHKFDFTLFRIRPAP